MHATDTILLSCLPLVMTKARVKFYPDLTSGFGEKVEQKDRHADRRGEIPCRLAVCTLKNR